MGEKWNSSFVWVVVVQTLSREHATSLIMVKKLKIFYNLVSSFCSVFVVRVSPLLSQVLTSKRISYLSQVGLWCNNHGGRTIRKLRPSDPGVCPLHLWSSCASSGTISSSSRKNSICDFLTYFKERSKQEIRFSARFLCSRPICQVSLIEYLTREFMYIAYHDPIVENICFVV